VLAGGVSLPEQGEGFRWLRQDDRHYGITRFVAAIERAAARVARERPGAPLMIGDLSTRVGGATLPHFSHRSGRDADLLLYLTTLEGVPVESPGFIPVGADGLAWDKEKRRYLRFDVEREWLLIKALVMDDDARVQFIFAAENIEAMVLEWARARGETQEALYRASEAMVQTPPQAGLHDDHLHVRIACSIADATRGCEPNGPARLWAREPNPIEASSDLELVHALLVPLEEPSEQQALSSRPAAEQSVAP
jgi:penicillin-insensitive murein endopeptidase